MMHHHSDLIYTLLVASMKLECTYNSFRKKNKKAIRSDDSGKEKPLWRKWEVAKKCAYGKSSRHDINDSNVLLGRMAPRYISKKDGQPRLRPAERKKEIGHNLPVNYKTK